MKKQVTPKSVDEYLARVPEPARGSLNKVRAAIRSVVPSEATEAISYGIPMFKYQGLLVGFAAFSKHCSLFPTSMAVMKTFKKELKAFQTSKGTIRFPLDKPPSAARRDDVQQSWRNSANLDALSARETGSLPSSQQRNPSLEKQRRCGTFAQRNHRVPVGCFSMAPIPRHSEQLKKWVRTSDTSTSEAAYEIQFPLAPKISRESRVGSLHDGKSVVGSTEARSRHPRAP
jgi:uncharacterized protein YdhG (YjbR/CyaY superfamily)